MVISPGFETFDVVGNSTLVSRARPAEVHDLDHAVKRRAAHQHARRKEQLDFWTSLMDSCEISLAVQCISITAVARCASTATHIGSAPKATVNSNRSVHIQTICSVAFAPLDTVESVKQIQDRWRGRGHAR